MLTGQRCRIHEGGAVSRQILRGPQFGKGRRFPGKARGVGLQTLRTVLCDYTAVVTIDHDQMGDALGAVLHGELLSATGVTVGQTLPGHVGRVFIVFGLRVIQGTKDEFRVGTLRH